MWMHYSWSQNISDNLIYMIKILGGRLLWHFPESHSQNNAKNSVNREMGITMFGHISMLQLRHCRSLICQTLLGFCITLRVVLKILVLGLCRILNLACSELTETEKSIGVAKTSKPKKSRVMRYKIQQYSKTNITFGACCPLAVTYTPCKPDMQNYATVTIFSIIYL